MALDPTALAAVARLIAIIPANFNGFNHQTVFPQTGNDMGVVANAIAAEALLAVNAIPTAGGTGPAQNGVAIVAGLTLACRARQVDRPVCGRA